MQSDRSRLRELEIRVANPQHWSSGEHQINVENLRCFRSRINSRRQQMHQLCLKPTKQEQRRTPSAGETKAKACSSECSIRAIQCLHSRNITVFCMFTLDKAIFPDTLTADAVPAITARFKLLSAEDQLALIWFAYLEMGQTITVAAPGAARMELARPILDQILAMSFDEQTKVIWPPRSTARSPAPTPTGR